MSVPGASREPEGFTPSDVCIVAPVNDEPVLNANLLRSPALAEGAHFLAKRGYSSASKAYNSALDAVQQPIVVFVHQDVYLPAPWLSQLFGAMRRLEKADPNWAILGLYGARADGSHAGRVWCSGQGCELGNAFDGPVPVVSIDELLIVMRRGAGVRFDEELEGFHLYGTDIVQTALAKGFGAYVIHAPVVHNTVRVKSLHGAYERAYRYIARKLRDRLPIPTVVVPITRWGGTMRYRELRIRVRGLLSSPQPGKQRPDAMQIAQRIGYETELQPGGSGHR
jgi:hypothetical protein